MRNIIKVKLTTSLILIAAHSTAYAAAFQYYELGTPIVGSADVGQAAEAIDASTSYFNPAGMTELQGVQFQLGSEIFLPYTNFQKSSKNTISGDIARNAGTLTPAVSMFYVYKYSPKLAFGLSLTSPYGGWLNYTDGWVGRYTVQYSQFYTLNFNPAVAYQFTDWASLGFGVSAEYANFSQTVALPLIHLVDGQANIRADNLAAGANVGLLLKPTTCTKLGIAYRSQITHNLKGNVTFLRINATPQVSTKIVMPQNVIVSLTQGLSTQINLLAEAGWSNWSSMKNTAINVLGYTAVTPRNWSNTYRVGLGAQWYALPTLMLQTGVSYDSSPTVRKFRLPDLPMDRQIRAGLGVLYTIRQMAQLGFSAEYINLGRASIYNDTRNGILAGNYKRNYAAVVQASVNINLCN